MKNYYNYSFYFAATTFALLSVVALLVPSPVLGFKLKQANIYCDIVSDSLIRESVGLVGSPYEFQNQSLEHMYMVGERVEYLYDSLVRAEKASKAVSAINASDRSSNTPQGVIPIEDFSDDGNHLAPLFAALDNATSRNVRIAMLGDSFIEGDLLSVDVRASFQSGYTGGGVGYMPITSQVSKARRSVGHNFSDNWRDNAITNVSSPSKYMLSGHWYEMKSDRAWVEYQGSNFRPHLASFDQATLLFISAGNTKIKAIVNGTQEFDFEPEASADMQSIKVNGDISKVRFEFSGKEGFVAYGAMLDDASGVSVDNYSVRGNSGLTLGSISGTLCQQMSRIAPYDLVVLEFGLNVVEQEVVHYGSYKSAMTKVIDHIKEVYPGVPIIVMGVSDRSTMLNGEFVTMTGVKAMDVAQREMARRCGVAFWSTLDAMKEMGGMAAFVRNGWAAKDYTHISDAGGRKVGQKLLEAILANR